MYENSHINWKVSVSELWKNRILSIENDISFSYYRIHIILSNIALNVIDFMRRTFFVLGRFQSSWNWFILVIGSLVDEIRDLLSWQPNKFTDLHWWGLVIKFATKRLHFFECGRKTYFARKYKLIYSSNIRDVVNQSFMTTTFLSQIKFK